MDGREGVKWIIFNNIGSPRQGPIHAVCIEVKKDERTIYYGYCQARSDLRRWEDELYACVVP